jgi:CBS domain-containing protein
VRPDSSTDEALAVMVSNHIRHVLLVNEKGAVVGLASARNLFQAHVESLDGQLNSLEAFVGHDGPGG